MFPFHQLTAYQKAKNFRKQVSAILKTYKIEEPFRSQLNRASLSIVLNIAEESGRYSKADRKNFFIIARGSVFECMAITDLLSDEMIIPKEMYAPLHTEADELSRLLYISINNLLQNSKK